MRIKRIKISPHMTSAVNKGVRRRKLNFVVGQSGELFQVDWSPN